MSFFRQPYCERSAGVSSEIVSLHQSPHIGDFNLLVMEHFQQLHLPRSTAQSIVEDDRTQSLCQLEWLNLSILFSSDAEYTKS